MRELPAAGTVHESVACISDPSVTYALYLPAALQGKSGEGKSWPVLLAFDPHGSGMLPVTAYRDLAERYGFILMGSNNSRNGVAAAETERIVTALLREAKAQYPADTNRVFLAGFSGGSRVATYAAAMFGGVKAVIGCGAGFVLPDPPGPIGFDFFGIAGTADFNLGEMIATEQQLAKTTSRHYLLEYPGPHAWPPEEVMEQGFRWITFNAMKDGALSRDQKQIGQYIAETALRIDSATREGRLFDAAGLCRQEIAFLSGLAPTDDYSRKLSSFMKDPEYLKQEGAKEAIMARERTEQQFLMDALFSKDINWWTRKIGSMKQEIASGKKPDDTLMNRRLLSFLSILCYSNATAAVKQDNRGAAENLIAVYELADPGNPEPNYLSSVILMRREDTIAALTQLDKSIAKGFSDRNRLLAQPEFRDMKNSPRWFDVIKKIK